MPDVLLIVSGITLGAIYALVALGFHLIYRTVNVLDFAQGDKVVIGGLVALSLVQGGVPLGLAIPLILAVGAAAGVLYEYVVIRPSLPRGVDAAVVATVGALLVLSSGHILIWGATAERFPPVVGGSVTIGGSPIDLQNFVIWAVVAVSVAAVALFLAKARYGKAMVAGAADPTAAGTVGIDVRQTRVVASAAAFSLAALAGLLIAPITLAGGVVGPALTLKGFTAAMLGGIGSTVGVVAGALILGLVEAVLGAQIPFAYRDPAIFGILILVLLLKPSGLFGREGRLV
ncbi:MAG: branched-chain amino acid transport system permease protein [bacterium]|jgi:branched-chain amino acid transport system permease protein